MDSRSPYPSLPQHDHLKLPASPSTFLNASATYTPSTEVPAPSTPTHSMSRTASSSSSASSTEFSVVSVRESQILRDSADWRQQEAQQAASSSSKSRAAAPADDASVLSSSLSPPASSLFEPSEGYTNESSSLGSSSPTSPSIHAVNDDAAVEALQSDKASKQKSRSTEPSHTSRFTSTPPGPLSHARSILEHQAASLLSAARRLREEEMTYKEFQAAQNLIVSTLRAGGKVVWTGVGKSGIIAQKLCATSLSLGMPATYLDPMSALHGDLGLLNGTKALGSSNNEAASQLPTPPADVVIALSHSGSSAELLALLPHLRLRGVKLVALTARHDSGLGSAAKESGGNWIDCRTAGYDNFPEPTGGSEEERSLCPTSSLFSLSSATAGTDEADPSVPAPTSSTTTALAMGDSLILSCAKMLGLGTRDFGKNHPGGALGKRMMAELEEKTAEMSVA